MTKSNFRILKPIFITAAIAVAATVSGCSGGGPRNGVSVVGTPQYAASGASSGAPLSSITVNSSTGVQPGDVIFAYVGTASYSSSTNITVTTPTGWTLVAGPINPYLGINSYLFQRISDGTDGARYTFNFSEAVSNSSYANQTTYRGVNNTTPVDGSISTAGQASGTSIVLPAVSPVGPLDLLVANVQTYQGFSDTVVATGMTNISQLGGQSAILSQQLSASGSTGSRTATNLRGGISTGFMFAVTPSRGAAGSPRSPGS